MSDDISRNQYRLLKKFCKSNVFITSMSKEQADDCQHLLDLGFLEPLIEYNDYIFSNGEHHPSPDVASYTTTAAGRAAIYSFKATFYKWWIPVIISIASLIVSIIALLIKI